MSNLSCGTHVAEPSANKDCRKLLNQFCRFLPKLKLPISADAKLPLTREIQSFFILFFRSRYSHNPTGSVHVPEPVNPLSVN